MEALVHDCVETSLRNWYNIAFTGSKSPKVCFPSSFPIYQGRYKILTSYSFIRKEVNTALHWIKLCSLIFVDSSIIIVNSLSQSPVFFSAFMSSLPRSGPVLRLQHSLRPTDHHQQISGDVHQGMCSCELLSFHGMNNFIFVKVYLYLYIQFEIMSDVRHVD